MTQRQTKRKLRLMELMQAKLKLEAPTRFSYFLSYVNHKYQAEWFHILIADHCQMLFEGKIKNLMVFMPPQHGKALSISTPILTANRGWVTHGDLRAGDYVYSPDGNAVCVEAVTPHYFCKSSIIHFREGEPIIAANKHEWGCYIPNATSHKAVFYPRIETSEIMNNCKGRSPYLMCAKPLKGKKKQKHFITTIVPCGQEVVNCIQVEGGYYLAGKELRPTHNSEIISRNFPAWALGKNPDLKIVGSSYTIDLASQFSRSIQRIIDSEEYRSVFPDTYLNFSNVRTDTKGYLRNVDIFETVGHHGFYKAVGVGGGLTGTPVDIAIIDDPVKDAAEANSPTYRQRVWDWYNTVLTTRLHNNSRQLFIMTRWHEDDLAGRILKAEPKDWTVLVIPAICETENDNGYSKRHIGEALWESKHSLEKLLKQKERSPRQFAALYQQRPTIEGGNIVKRDWFKIISQADFKALRYREPVHFYLDTAYNKKKPGQDNDPSGILAACRIGNNIYLIHAQSVYKEMPDLLRFIPDYINANYGNSESILHIEPKANGVSVVQMLKEITTLNVKETPRPDDNKEVRFRVVSPRVECGRVFMVQGSWNEEFLEQVCAFPASTHDEYVDILGYAINDLIEDDLDIDFDNFNPI